MKSYRKELWFNIPTRRAFVNITSEVEMCLKESGITEGMALVFTSPSRLPLRDFSKSRATLVKAKNFCRLIRIE